MEYIVILLIILFLSYTHDYKGGIKYKAFNYNALLVILILFMGLRYRIGLDTIRYLQYFYVDDPTLDELSFETFFQSSYDPFYLLFVSSVKTIFGRFYFVQLFQSAIVNILLFRYFAKHTQYIFTCVLFYFLWRYVSFTSEEMRASIAIAICLYANDYAKEGKRLKSILFILIAAQFHLSAYFLLPVPFLTFFRINKVSLVVIIATYFVGLLIQLKFADIIEMLTVLSFMHSHSDTYIGSELASQTLNFNGVMAVIITYVVYSYVSVGFFKKLDGKVTRFEAIEPFIFLGLFFAIVSIPFSLMYRFTRFFEPYLMILYAEMLIELSHNIIVERKILKYYISIAYFSPFFLLILSDYTGSVGDNIKTYSRYYPYYSVLSKETDPSREKLLTFYKNTEFFSGDY